MLLNCAGNAGYAGNAGRVNRLLQDYLQGVTQKVTHTTTGLARVTAQVISGLAWVNSNLARVTSRANSGHHCSQFFEFSTFQILDFSIFHFSQISIFFNIFTFSIFQDLHYNIRLIHCGSPTKIPHHFPPQFSGCDDCI